MSKTSDKKGLSRRQFLGLTGGVVGAAALTTMGLSKYLKVNKREIDLEKIEYEQKETDLLVVGGGIAGLFAAVKGHDAGAKVLMVSKGRLGSSGQTPFAKGIFAYNAATEKKSIDDFVDEVTRSAIGTNNPVFTRQMAEHSQARVDELKTWGFFDSPLYYNSFSKPINDRNIPVMERIMITHLIKENGKIAGASGFSIDEAKVYTFKAKSVVLCTGAGGFKPNGFPICDLTHDGSVMAYNIGAKITGKEWNDGHPAQAVNAAACFDGWKGMFEMKPSVNSIGINHHLGVDSNYSAYILGHSPESVSMGPGMAAPTEVNGGPYTPEEFQMSGHPGRAPGRDDAAGGDRPEGGHPGGEKSEGGPPGMGGVTVGGSSAGMAIHKSEGLVPIDEKGATNIPGLYAAGDALGSYMSGGIYTQIGSSMAGSAVQGAIVSEAAAEYSKGIEMPKISQAKIKEIEEEILAPLKRDKGYGPAWVTQILQGIMIPNFILYIKKESLLKAALAYVEELRDHHKTMMRAADLHELRLAHETSSMIVNAEMKLKASLMRKESRCSHYRLDYPEVDYDNWQAWINISKGSDGEMKLEKQAFGSWPS